MGEKDYDTEVCNAHAPFDIQVYDLHRN